jgi:hypothetical protein
MKSTSEPIYNQSDPEEHTAAMLESQNITLDSVLEVDQKSNKSLNMLPLNDRTRGPRVLKLRPSKLRQLEALG